jgi:hypothetical protein
MAARKQTTKKTATSPATTRPRLRGAGRPKVDRAELEALIEEATVDAYGEEEQRMGFFTMLEDNLDVPFETEVLGAPVEVTGIAVNDAEEIVAVCRHGKHTQRIPLVDLPLPTPPPEGFAWIEAYRLFAGCIG